MAFIRFHKTNIPLNLINSWMDNVVRRISSCSARSIRGGSAQKGAFSYSQPSLKRTASGPAPTVRLIERLVTVKWLKTERQEPTSGVRLEEMSVKTELTVYERVAKFDVFSSAVFWNELLLDLNFTYENQRLEITRYQCCYDHTKTSFPWQTSTSFKECEWDVWDPLLTSFFLFILM